jgi:hypothetical protein
VIAKRRGIASPFCFHWKYRAGVRVEDSFVSSFASSFAALRFCANSLVENEASNN